MAVLSNNWIQNKDVVRERDKNAAVRAEKLEAKKIKKGYRWVRIDARTKALVECDKNGQPTKLGLMQIENVKNM